MTENKCPNYGAPLDSHKCAYCGSAFNNPRQTSHRSSHYVPEIDHTCDAKTFAEMRKEWGPNWRRGWIRLPNGRYAEPPGGDR